MTGNGSLPLASLTWNIGLIFRQLLLQKNQRVVQLNLNECIKFHIAECQIRFIIKFQS